MRGTRWMRIIGIWQMTGGAVALASFLDSYGTLPHDHPAVLGLVALAAVVAIISVVAGYGLFRGVGRALPPSLIVQGLQLLGFNLGTFAYQLTLGPYLYLTINWGAGVSLGAGFKPLFLLRWGMLPGSTSSALNLLACWCFWKLLWTEPAQMREPTPTSDSASNALAPAPDPDGSPTATR